MDDTKDRIVYLKDKRDQLKWELKEIDSELMQIVLEFKGTLVEALKLEIVKLNFPLPPNFKNYINNS